MAAAAALSESGLEEGEYESDSDGTSALALRRREASDDEERELPLDATYSADDDDIIASASQRSFSDEEREGEGTPPVEDDVGEEDDEGAASLRRRRLLSDEEDDREGLHQEDGNQGLGHAGKAGDKEDAVSQGQVAADGANEGKETREEEKKEAEPFVVPTAGAFYMHDDRFRGVGGARPRRGMAGRKLWEAKDDKPWVHDLFEELSVRDENFSGEGLSRTGRGRSRGRGRVNRDRNRGWVGKLASDSEELNMNRARRGRGKGRPPKHEVGDHTIAEEPVPSKASFRGKGLQDNRVSSSIESLEENKHHESSAPLRKVVAGSLNSASPPFFPSSALQQKAVDGSKSNQVISNQSTKGRDKATKASGSHGTPVFVARTSGVSGRGTNAGVALQSSTQSQQPAKLSTAPTAAPLVRTSSSQGQPSIVPSSQSQQSQQPQTSGSSIQVPASSGQPVRPKSNGGRGGRGGSSQVVGGRGGSFVYNGGPTAGIANGVQKVEPGFAPPIPSVGPVAVQYGGHPPAGIPLPAVGMAMPNYSGQPQFGFPNSEVTWIPVLAGGGTIGTGYATPYMTMEGTPSPVYYPQAATQPATFRPPGREVNGSKPTGLWKPPPNQELGPDDFGHRQNKPRRYSEMNFGQ